MAVDRPTARASKWLSPPDKVDFDGRTHFALVSVNFSTTRYLKLMLLTLCEQDDLTSLNRVVIVDNGSRDGGREFVDRLGVAISHLVVVRRRWRLHHGPAMRHGVRALDRADRDDVVRSNVLLFCDADVVFRSPDALSRLATEFDQGAALAGEPRRTIDAGGPDIQASFFAVRRDVYARRDVRPLVHGGAPARAMQSSVARAGLEIGEFRGNRDGMILHRGRTGVAAAAEHHPRHAYASVQRNRAHFMGVRHGQEIWTAVEERYGDLLHVESEAALVRYLAERLNGSRQA